MIRAKWKPVYLYFKFLKFRMRCSEIKKFTMRMKKKNLMFRLRNKRSILDLNLSLLNKMNNYRLYIYNGRWDLLLRLDKYVIGSRIGEFIFTKFRSKLIHGTGDGKGRGRKKSRKKHRKKRRFLGFNNSRARKKQEIRGRIRI